MTSQPHDKPDTAPLQNFCDTHMPCKPVCGVMKSIDPIFLGQHGAVTENSGLELEKYESVI